MLPNCLSTELLLISSGQEGSVEGMATFPKASRANGAPYIST